MRGPVYWHPRIYRSVMHQLYGAELEERYLHVANLVEPGWSVLDLCCGDCGLADYVGADRYLGIDANGVFLDWARRTRGVRAETRDIRAGDIPSADCIVMMSSLYQFIPEHQDILTACLRAARRRVIISEPVRNVAQKSKFWSAVSGWVINPGYDWSNQRFTACTLETELARCGDWKSEVVGREVLSYCDIGVGTAHGE